MLILIGGCALGSETKPLVKEVVTTAVELQSAHSYANNTNQQWVIEAPAGALNTGVVFDRFETEDGFDFVNLYDGDGIRVHHLVPFRQRQRCVG